MEKLERPLTWALAIGILTFLFMGNCCKTNSEILSEIPVTNNSTSTIFEKNCETVKEYDNAFCKEDIDYERFYALNAIVKGTTFGAKDSMNVEDRKVAHQEMWQKYDFSTSQPLNLLPGVNPETKEMDGSVRTYFNLTITLTENEKSITIPMYESYDFDEDGKIVFYQFYGDLTSAILSLEK